jgi:uncharacterized phosphosugar-binding protein
MNRRESLSLFPLALAGFAGLTVPLKASGQISAVKAIPLATQYLGKVREMLLWIESTQSDSLMEAAYVIAQTVKNGGRCWSNWDMGHNFRYDIFPDRNGDPGIFTIGYDANFSKKGDLFLVSLYGGAYDDMLEKDIYIIGGPAPHMASNKGDEELREEVKSWNPRPYAKLWIETNISRLGAIMDIPGSTVKAGPASGIIGMTTFWMMMADACRILARDGVILDVQGDEPVLGGKETNYTWERNKPVSLHEPLMDNYLTELLDQITMIEAEMGHISKAADMVVDTVLAGGTVYVYSRYRNSLAVESNTRRGGLSMFIGIFDGGDESDFKISHAHVEQMPLTSKDCVIMGFTKPDDEVDLDNFRKFRKAGMKIASIGPMTRDFYAPKGPTIPRASDIHIGRMSDSYGLFVIPGFNRKVCPTSGAVNNLIFFALSLEIIERFRERTGGDVPGIFANVALKNGRPQMGHMIELYRETGW